MKKLTITIIILMISFASAELINNNPDPNGEPWLSGGLSPLTSEQQKNIDAIPELTLPESYYTNKEVLPYKIDNSQLPYFRPVFNQKGGSCGQAAGVAYTFTYEMNLLKGTAADVAENQYPTHYTYNFLNNGNGNNGSWHFDGWNIINAGGCPTVSEYGGLWPTEDVNLMYKLWMNGYENYENSMEKRVLEQITLRFGTPESLEIFKHWLYDHCNGSSAGGLGVFTAGVSFGFSQGYLPEGTENEGSSIVLKWGTTPNHAMTFAGYNDSIRYDFNSDGIYTNDIDQTGDGIVDMRDWEIGGLLMVNSWGDGWQNKGKMWVAYRTLAEEVSNGGVYKNMAHSIRITESFVPALKLKATIDCRKRNELKITAGIANDINAIMPEYTIQFPYFDYQGGDGIGMTGNGNVLELGLDITRLLKLPGSSIHSKFFLCVNHQGDPATAGKVISFSIIDNDGYEAVSEQSEVPIIANSLTFITVDGIYHPSGVETVSPATFELMTNYPNPFNPSTTINFKSENEKLSLYIFNNKGEIVDTVFENRNLNSGMHEVKWTAGSEFTSGVYYYGIVSKDKIKHMKKMTLLK